MTKKISTDQFLETRLLFFGLIPTNKLVRHTLNVHYKLSEYTINHLSFRTSEVNYSLNWQSIISGQL